MWKMLDYLSKPAIMGFITVLLLAPLSNIVQCCRDNEHVGGGNSGGC